MALTETAVSDWLARYKRSWETQDADLFVTLFTPTCEYRDNPWIEPVPGREFHAFWKALATIQRDNHIDLEIMGLKGDRAIVNWKARYTRLPAGEKKLGNGIFRLTFAPDGRVSDLLEWQHWTLEGAPLEKRVFTWKQG